MSAAEEHDLPVLTEVVEDAAGAANEPAAAAEEPAPVSAPATVDPVGLEALAHELETQIIGRLTPEIARVTAQAVREALAAAIKPPAGDAPKD